MTSEQTSSPTLNEIRDLQEFFTMALSQLQGGQIMSMTGVDMRISAVCQAAQNSPPEQQQIFLPELTVLINLLNSYEDELRKLQSSLAAEAAKGADNGAHD